MDLLKDEYRTARKAYRDDAYYLILDHVNDGYFSIADLREVVKQKRRNGKILPGEKYRYLCSVDAGKIYVWRESLTMSALLHKYELYDEW